MTRAAAAAEIVCFVHSEPHCWLCADIARLHPATIIHREPARDQSHNPQHFGADVGRVGDRRVNVHREPSA